MKYVSVYCVTISPTDIHFLTLIKRCVSNCFITKIFAYKFSLRFVNDIAESDTVLILKVKIVKLTHTKPRNLISMFSITYLKTK